jgi:hypothetical protein
MQFSDKQIRCFQLILAFLLGLVSALTSPGILTMLGFLIIYEIFLYMAGRFTNDQSWTLHVRVGAGLVYILGWLVGRLIVQQPISTERDLHHVIKRYINRSRQ